MLRKLTKSLLLFKWDKMSTMPASTICHAMVDNLPRYGRQFATPPFLKPACLLALKGVKNRIRLISIYKAYNRQAAPFDTGGPAL